MAAGSTTQSTSWADSSSLSPDSYRPRKSPYNREGESDGRILQCWPKETLRILFYEAKVPSLDEYSPT